MNLCSINQQQHMAGVAVVLDLQRGSESESDSERAVY